jgi:hypothetical protein
MPNVEINQKMDWLRVEEDCAHVNEGSGIDLLGMNCNKRNATTRKKKSRLQSRLFEELQYPG